jgi:large-conductance mechanosensitive channel
MLSKVKGAIHSVLRIQKGEGNQFLTHDGKQRLIETKVFFRKYTRLLAGLFVSAVSVSLASLLIVYGVVMYVVMPLIEGKLLGHTSLDVTISEKATLQFGPVIGYFMIFLIAYLMAWLIIRNLTGAVETPQEERRRRCPMCGEQILEMAIKCKHCGSTVGRERAQTYQPPRQTSSRPARERSEPSRQRPDKYSAPPPRRNQDTPSERREDTFSSSRSSSGRSSSPSSRRRTSAYTGRRKGGRYHSRRDDRSDSRSRNHQSRDDRQ